MPLAGDPMIAKERGYGRPVTPADRDPSPGGLGANHGLPARRNPQLNKLTSIIAGAGSEADAFYGGEDVRGPAPESAEERKEREKRE